MHQNQFDEQIKQALENLPKQVNPSPSGWERLQHLLEQEGLGEEPNTIVQEEINEKFDDEVRKKITHYSLTPYFQNRHWLQFAERLDEQNERVYWLYKHKFAEISIVFLLFLALFNLSENSNSKLEAHILPILGGTKEKLTNVIIEDNTIDNDKKTASLPTIEIKEKWAISNAAKTPKTNYKKKSLELLKKMDNRVALLPIPVISKVATNNLIEFSIPPIPILELNKTMESNDKKGFTIDYVNAKEKKYWTSVGLIATCDLNQIYTPSDYFLGKKIDEYTTYAFSGGGGFTLSRESKNNSFEIGLIYNTKRYHPKKLNILATNDRGIVFEEKLSNVQINVLQIPLNYRYKFLKKTNINYFTGLGAALNVITQANYDNDRQYLVPDYALRMIEENQPPSPIENAKKFNAGLFEGGIIQENIYFAAQATLGLEYKLTDKVSLFNQVSYQRHISLKGIGANHNSFHAYSLWLGLRRNF